MQNNLARARLFCFRGQLLSLVKIAAALEVFGTHIENCPCHNNARRPPWFSAPPLRARARATGSSTSRDYAFHQ